MNKWNELVSKQITIKIPVWIFIAAPFILYIVWEAFWYTRIKWNFITWHTHIMVYVYAWLAGFAVFYWINKRKPIELLKNLFIAFTSLLFTLALAEIYLHVDGRNKTYLEKVNGFYTSHYTPQDLSHYHAWTTYGKPHLIKKPEYSFVFPTNSLGLPDAEWPRRKQKDEIRILTLGDSFTEGDGAPYDSSYPNHLQRMLKDAGYQHIRVMNGGVCGSDPFFNYVALRDLLLPYQPDVVLQELSSDDITTDIAIRGGMERFLPNGKLQYRNAPWWEPIYAISYLSRFYFHAKGYNELLRKGYPDKNESEEINQSLVSLFNTYTHLASDTGLQLVVFLKPSREEIMENQYVYNFAPVIAHLKQLHIEVFDLLPFYRKYVAENKTDVKDYFWVYDGHHNAKGYRMMAEGVYKHLQSQLSAKITLAQAHHIP